MEGLRDNAALSTTSTSADTERCAATRLGTGRLLLLFFPLSLPYGMAQGFAGVTLGAIALHRGIALTDTVSLVALSRLPHSIKFLWAPAVDTTLGIRRWYLFSVTLTAGALVALATALDLHAALLWLGLLTILSQVGATLAGMACEWLLGNTVVEEQRGRAGGFYQAGTLAGWGVGGGAALWLASRVSGAVVGAMVGAVSLASALPLLLVAVPARERRSFARSMLQLGSALRTTLRNPRNWGALALCLSPLGAAGATNFFSVFADDWHVTPDLVALVTGTVGGLVAIPGALLGGWLSDRVSKRAAYALAGGLVGLCALGLACSPRIPPSYVIWTLAYSLANGIVYGTFTGLILETIGSGAVATQYSLFASLTYLANYYMAKIELAAHLHWGARGVLLAEAGCTAITLLLLALLRIGRFSRRRGAA